MSLPALRTVRGGERLLRTSDWWIVGLVTLALPPAAGSVLPPLVEALARFDPLAVPGLAHVLALIAAQVAAPILTWLLVPLGLFVGSLAMRHGWAGWAVATGLPAALAATAVFAYAPTSGYPVRTHIAPAAVFAGSAFLHGAVAWIALRLRRPEALAPR